MKTTRFILAFLATTAINSMAVQAIACSTPATPGCSSNATKYVVSNPQSASSTAGYGTEISKWSAAYDVTSGTPQLSLDVAMGTNTVSDDGFWMVVNNGGNPKGIVDQLAILYGDLKNNKITAYKYDGGNSPNSYVDASAYLMTFDVPFKFQSTTEYSFNLDVSALNSINLPNWKGAQFGDTAGIWFHNTRQEHATYNGNLLTSFSQNDGWMDTDHTPTVAFCADGKPRSGSGCKCSDPGTPVPEPGSLGMLGMAFAALGVAMRRRKV